MRILVAEDDPTIRQLMVTLLRRKAIDCTPVENGKGAVDAWEEQQYDLIFMDVQMPIVDGLQATRRIREKEVSRGGHTPIIAITAHAMPADKEKCLEAGMDDYLSKPINVDQLFSLLEKDYSKEH